MSTSDYIKKVKERMISSLESYKKNLSGVRAGRASPDLLNSIRVEAYGSPMPLAQLATVSVQDASMITVQVWDKTVGDKTLKAIQSSDLGVNPIKDGDIIRVPLPKLSEERRKELVKLCANHAEQAKVAVRNIRRDEIDEVKKLNKSSDISEDEMHQKVADIQKVTDDFSKEIDELLSTKQLEIMKV